MKTTRIPTLLLTFTGVAALALAGCSDSSTRDVTAPATTTTPAAKAGDPVPSGIGNTPVMSDIVATPAVAATEWAAIQNLGFDDRADFMAGLDRLQTDLDTRITKQTTRRSTLTTADGSPVAWDNAMKAVATARTRLVSFTTDLGKANADNWDQLKERVATAWTDANQAYATAVAAAPATTPTASR